jgi:hypothetical protein
LTDLLGLETLMGAMITVESASKAGAVATGRAEGSGKRRPESQRSPVALKEPNGPGRCR